MSFARSRTLAAILLASILSSSFAVRAGDAPDHRISLRTQQEFFTEFSCSPVEVRVDSADTLTALQFSVCTSSAILSIRQMTAAPAIADRIEFADGEMVETGGFLRLVFDDTGPDPFLPAGEGIHVATMEYCCAGWPSCTTFIDATIRLCDGAHGDEELNFLETRDRTITVGEGLVLSDGRFECVGECPPPPEDCFDGEDNDDNGLVDCEDPSCHELRACRGRQLPGDCNQDGALDVSDASCLFGMLFLGRPAIPPCSRLPTASDGTVVLLDWQADTRVDLSDGVALLEHLFRGGPPHAAAIPLSAAGECIRIPGCPDNGTCPSGCAGPPEACPTREPEEGVFAADFIRGDANGNGRVEITDAVSILNWICLDGAPPSCLDAADVNDDGCVRIDDALMIPGVCPFLAIGGCPIPAPHPEPGPDQTLDLLGCGEGD